MPAYRFKPGFSCGVPVATVGKEMERIRKREKAQGVKPAQLVEAAQDINSPLHPAFEWDDEECGRLHRIEQARAIIRNIVVVHQTSDDDRPTYIQAFLSTEVEGGGRQYVSTARICANEEMLQFVLTDALASLCAWRKRYEHIQELAPLIAAMEAETAELKSSAGGKK